MDNYQEIIKLEAPLTDSQQTPPVQMVSTYYDVLLFLYHIEEVLSKAAV